MIQRQIRFFGEDVVLACDGRCDKAWGINGRAEVLLSDKDDDHIYVPDSALGTAGQPGTWEGGDGRPSDVPLRDSERMNKWCARECERSGIFGPKEEVIVPDLENPTPNIPGRPVPFVRDTEGRVCLSFAKHVDFWDGDRHVSKRVKAGVPLIDVLSPRRSAGGTC